MTRETYYIRRPSCHSTFYRAHQRATNNVARRHDMFSADVVRHFVTIVTVVGVIVLRNKTIGGLLPDPSFDSISSNVTIVAGETAILHCSIDYLGKYKVVWMDSNALALTYDDRRMIDDVRFSITRPYIKQWNLVIRDVRRTDSGKYCCTVNTVPVKNKTVLLQVNVPPQINSRLSSDVVTSREGDDIVLTCNVTGVPQPEVTWFRRSVFAKTVSYIKESLGTSGSYLVIQNVTRYCGDQYFLYECAAQNGVPPAAIRQIQLTVEYPPEIVLTTRKVGQRKGQDVVLDCTVNASPLDGRFWERGRHRLGTTSGSRHSVEEIETDIDNIRRLRLTIVDLQTTDYGDYKCVAYNRHGREEQKVVIYEYMEADQQQQLVKASRLVSTAPTTPNSLAAVHQAKQPSSKTTDKQSLSDRWNTFNSGIAAQQPRLTALAQPMCILLLPISINLHRYSIAFLNFQLYIVK